MPTKTITLACALSAEEFKRLKSICDKEDTYPSAAIREAVMEWMAKHENLG